MLEPRSDSFPSGQALAVIERPPQTEYGNRILVLAPTGNDGRLTVEFFTKAGLEPVLCADITELCTKLDAGCGAVLLAEEGLANGGSHFLARRLEAQPSWSDLPVIIVTGKGDAVVRRLLMGAVGPVGNVSMIERPVRPGTLVSTLRFALGSRARQYQVRALFEEREKLTMHLQELDRRKDEFLAMLAHELRNPLASVASAAQLLKSSNEAECHEWAAKVIERQTRQLARLIDDLLDASRITTGKIRLHKQVIDAAISLDRACESVRPLARERGHEIVCDYRHDSLWLEADPTRLEQIFVNLLTNAVKYTQEGGRIELSATRAGTEISIAVRDNGMGIAPDRMPEMFQLFTQGERSIARSEGGLGIGLTVVQKLVELHGGRVDAHSDGPGSGCTFNVYLPADAAPLPWSRASSDSPEVQGDAQRVLIVDDNLDSAQGLARLLARAGHQTLLAHDGAQALEQARAHRPDVIVLDIGLPRMDGFEVARQLRETPPLAGALIIGLTGYGQEEDRQRAISAGFDHYLVKPADIVELKRLINGPAHAEKAGTS